ncbi:Uncharacterized protein dnm_037970 [Desulfonema magnum]|uniref:Uncharacterized protein n=1 Tax=Desulfonema magnum TaxID=45655 RepID=A0A975BMR6_9BACT|nr:Uncharacterized protein dnm_037970 [Desulfonema magnum]
MSADRKVSVLCATMKSGFFHRTMYPLRQKKPGFLPHLSCPPCEALKIFSIC